MHKRFWAAFLAVCIMVFMMPSTVLAVGSLDDPWIISADDGVSEVNAYITEDDAALSLIITGSGKMKDFDTASNKFEGYRREFSHVKIEENITNIGSYLFYKSVFPYIILPSTIKDIHEHAFAECDVSIIDLTKLSDDTNIAQTAFSDKYIKIIYLPSEKLSSKIVDLNQNTVRAVTNGGRFSDGAEYKPDELLTPTKDKCKFEGWYTDSACTNKAQFAGGTISGTYYAKWSSTQIPPKEDENKGQETQPDKDTTTPVDPPDPQQPDNPQDTNPDTPKDDDKTDPPQTPDDPGIGEGQTGGDTAQDPSSPGTDEGGSNNPQNPGASEDSKPDTPSTGDSEGNKPDTPSTGDSEDNKQDTPSTGNSENTTTPNTPSDPEKLNYDMSGIEFKDATKVYNGKAQGLEITGTLPKGVTVTYIYENDLAPVTPGEYNIIAKFIGDTEHYNPIPSKMATLTIEKAEMKLSFGYPTLKVLLTDKPFINDLIGAPKDSIITYKTDNVKVADVSQTGEVTIVGEGKTTITASASETPLYKAESVSYELTVTANKPSEEDPEDDVLSTIVYPNGAKVIVPKNPGKTMSATVVVPDKLDHAVVTIPMKDVVYGTVALNAATGEITKLCIPDSDGLTVLLERSMNLIMYDNSKTFQDIPDAYWGKDFINFATAHELFAGTSETQFSPDIPMTRGMMMTVLASFADVDTKGGSVWYERGMNWAKAMGISDGTYPNNDITREQLAVMLYHYVKDPGISADSSETLAKNFTDADKISEYAVTAMSWAVENGVIKGMTDNSLSPQGKATRAQVATMMKRICEFIVNENV